MKLLRRAFAFFAILPLFLLVFPAFIGFLADQILDSQTVKRYTGWLEKLCHK